MTDLEKIEEWLHTFPLWDSLVSDFHVDYTNNIPSNGGIFPAGIVENRRIEDIVGNVSIDNQYNFGLYTVLVKPTDDDIQALVNANWVSDFQKWVQEQSARHLAPTFGDEPERERMQAQNGTLYSVSEDGTTAMYLIQLSAQFRKNYKI